MIISPPSGSTTAGENSSLLCSANIIITNDETQPTFEWFFGPNNRSLPSGVNVTPTAAMDAQNMYNYSSSLQFSPLNQSHTGTYTCRLGNNARLADTALFTVTSK